MAWTPYLELSLEVSPLKMSRLSFWLTRICWQNDVLESRSTKKNISKRTIRGKVYRFWFEHGWRSRSKFQCDYRWSSRWSQTALEKVPWSSESTNIERSWSDRKNLLRSLSRQQQMLETINYSWATFSRYIPTFSFEVVRIFLSKTFQWLSSAARASGLKVQVHVINQFRSYHVTSIFSLGP